MKVYLYLFLVLILSYIVGSFPSGYIFYKLKTGKDIRKEGKRKNIGATNVLIEGGKVIGILTLIFDISKGALPVILVRKFSPDNLIQKDLLTVFSGLVAVLGHVFPIFLNFKGGKGLATTLGALLAIFPEILISYLFIFMLLTPIIKRPALLGLILFSIFPIILYLKEYNAIYVGMSSLFAIMYIYLSLGHFKSMLKGEEYKETMNSLKKFT
ncbi:MAG: glycerol-3-phosphate acyltransferase [bacterium]|nr:glycerol-3-phosphate acyltransferase [bacterium]